MRGLTPLQKGDELIPIYPMLYDDGSDSDEFAEDTFEGDPIIVGDTLPVFEYVSALKGRTPRSITASS